MQNHPRKLGDVTYPKLAFRFSVLSGRLCGERVSRDPLDRQSESAVESLGDLIRSKSTLELEDGRRQGGNRTALDRP